MWKKTLTLLLALALIAAFAAACGAPAEEEAADEAAEEAADAAEEAVEEEAAAEPLEVEYDFADGSTSIDQYDEVFKEESGYTTTVRIQGEASPSYDADWNLDELRIYLKLDGEDLGQSVYIVVQDAEDIFDWPCNEEMVEVAGTWMQDPAYTSQPVFHLMANKADITYLERKEDVREFLKNNIEGE